MNQSQLESAAWHSARWSARNCHALVVNASVDAGLLDQITFFTLNSVSKLYISWLHFLNYLLLKEQYKSSLGNNLALSVPNNSSAFHLFSSQNLHAHKKILNKRICCTLPYQKLVKLESSVHCECRRDCDGVARLPCFSLSIRTGFERKVFAKLCLNQCNQCSIPFYTFIPLQSCLFFFLFLTAGFGSLCRWEKCCFHLAVTRTFAISELPRDHTFLKRKPNR